MAQYFARLDGRLRVSLKDNKYLPVENDLRDMLELMDGEQRWATSIAALPSGLDMYSAKDDDFLPDDFLQAGGSAARMTIELGRSESGEAVLYTLGRSAPDLTEQPSEVVSLEDASTDVYPEEVWTAEEALVVFAHYFHHDQTLPSGVHLRRTFD